jgi:hypothetical protein
MFNRHHRAHYQPRTWSGFCELCGRKIRWVKTIAGKPMPLDPAEHRQGNVMLINVGTELLAKVLPHDLVALANRAGLVSGRYFPHFATCPSRKLDAKAKAMKPKLYVGEPNSEFHGLSNGQLQALLGGTLKNKRVCPRTGTIFEEPWPPGTFEAARKEIMDRQNRGCF